jgi:hypothetical protein
MAPVAKMITTEVKEVWAAAATRRVRFTPKAFRVYRTPGAEAEADLLPSPPCPAAAEGLASSSFDTTPDVSQTARRDARFTVKSV